MPNYLRNTWYVAAEPAEINQGRICARRILTDFGPDRPEFADAVHAGFVFAFEQDRAVIAAQAQRVPDHGHDFTSMTRVCFAGDGLQNQGRQMIANMVTEEQDVVH